LVREVDEIQIPYERTVMASPKLNVYSEDEIKRKLKEMGLDEWYYEDGWLRRKYNTDGWPTTLMLVNAIGYLAEAAWHHPDLSVSWGKLGVQLRTHDANGITDRDFELARKIEDIALWRPGPESALEGTPNKFVFSKK
jgi:4a-hydroxytetrahydrobiopterin dehydratase